MALERSYVKKLNEVTACPRARVLGSRGQGSRDIAPARGEPGLPGSHLGSLFLLCKPTSRRETYPASLPACPSARMPNCLCADQAGAQHRNFPKATTSSLQTIKK